MISPLLVASTGARTTLLALADTRRSWAPPTPTPRIPDQVVGVAPRSAPLQAAGAFDALLVCAPLVYSINKSLYDCPFPDFRDAVESDGTPRIVHIF